MTIMLSAPIIKSRITMRQSQQGAVLFIALIMLLVMTLIGVTSLNSTLMEERMAGNMREINIAFQSAEAALREGEKYLEGATLPSFDGTNGLYKPATAGNPQVWDVETNWNTSGSSSTQYSGAIPDLAAQPRYMIEELPAVPAPGGTTTSDTPAPDTGMYRVTARSLGRSDTTIIMLQSTYKR